MWKILRTELLRACMDLKTYAAAVLIILIYIDKGRIEHWQHIYGVLISNEELYFVAPSLLGLVSASSFADDLNSGYYRPMCLRYGVSAYVRAKAMYIMIAPLCLAMICHVAFFLSMVMRGVELHEDTLINDSQYLGWALNYGHWWPYMLGGGLCLGMASCLLISMAAYASVYIHSRLFIWVMPIMMNMVCFISTSYLRVSNIFNINRLMRGTVGGLDPCPTLWLLILLVLPTVLIMWAFVRAAKRRVLNA